MSNVYKVVIYQEIDLGEEIVIADNEQQAIQLAEQLNYKTGIGLKYAGNYKFDVEVTDEYCIAHKELECLDEMCYEQMTGEKP